MRNNQLKNIVLILLLVYFDAFDTKRPYTIDVSHCNYTQYNAQLLRRVECTVGRTRGLSQIYAEFMLAQDHSAFTMRSTFDMLRKDDTKINLMNFELAGCKFLEAYYGNIIMKIGLHELHRVSNLPRKCPVSAGVLYIVNNYTVNPDDYPSFTPAMSWVMKVEFWTNGQHQLDFILSGRVRKI